MSYSLIEAYRELQEEVDENLFANYVSDLWVFNDVLTNRRILTNFNQKSARDFDYRGNHICLTNDLINPPAIMPQLNFGVVIDKAKLEDYIKNNPDKFRQVLQFGLNTKDLPKTSLDVHDDSRYRRWLEIRNSEGKPIKNKASGMFIQGLSYYNGTYYLKFKQWTWRPVPKGSTGKYDEEVVEFIEKLKNIFNLIKEKQEERNKVNLTPQQILSYVLNENTNKNESLYLKEGVFTLKRGGSKEGALKLISVICKLLDEYYTINFTDFYDHFNNDTVKWIKEQLINIYSDRRNGKSYAPQDPFTLIAFAYKNGNFKKSEKLFYLDKKELDNPNYPKYFKTNLEFGADDFIYCVGADNACGINSYLLVKDSVINKNFCISLKSYLDKENGEEKEVTDCTVSAINFTERLSKEDEYILDKLILNEHEYRLYTKEVSDDKQTSIDFENIKNAYFNIGDIDDIIIELKLPKIYKQYNVNNDKATKPVFEFDLYNWLRSTDLFKDKNLKKFIFVSSNKQGAINSVFTALKNDLIDLYKNLQLYKKNNVKIHFYQTTEGPFRSTLSSYIDNEKKDYSSYIKDDELTIGKGLNLNSIPSSSYETIDAWISDNNKPWIDKPFYQTYINIDKDPDENKTTTNLFVKVQVPGSRSESIARIQTASLIYYLTDNYEKAENEDDKLKNIYVLLYNDSGHPDIPHSGISDKGDKDTNTMVKTALKTLETETGLRSDLVSNFAYSRHDYLYYENAQGYFRNTFKEKDGIPVKKWFYYYNRLFVGRLNQDKSSVSLSGNERAYWLSLYDLFKTHGGQFSHVNFTIYKLFKTHLKLL